MSANGSLFIGIVGALMFLISVFAFSNEIGRAAYVG
jgi:hypothetical protein